MSAQEADNTYNEPLDYEDPAEQEPYVDTIMDEATEPPVAQPQQTPSVQPSTAVPQTAQSLTSNLLQLYHRPLSLLHLLKNLSHKLPNLNSPMLIWADFLRAK